MPYLAPNLKLLFHNKALNEFKDSRITSRPVNVEISPTNLCNANCPWCFYRISEYKVKHSKEEMPILLLKSALADLKEMGCKAVSWTGGGEPTIYSGFDEVTKFAHELGLKQGLFTNGYKTISFPERFSWIRISLTDALKIPKSAYEYPLNTKTGINLNLTAQNSSYAEELVKDARLAKVNYFQIRPALAEKVESQEKVNLPLHLKKYETDDFKVLLTEYKFDDYLNKHRYDVCYGHNFVPFIWHNGDVSVCAYHFNKPEFTFGNLNRNTFKEIWFGEHRKKMLVSQIKVTDNCQHCCKNHEINKVLHDFVNVSDVDFL